VAVCCRKLWEGCLKLLLPWSVHIKSKPIKDFALSHSYTVVLTQDWPFWSSAFV
jgi:hypothetical protein